MCTFFIAERKLQSNEFPHNLYIQNYSTATPTCITLKKWLFSPSKDLQLQHNEMSLNFLFWQVSLSLTPSPCLSPSSCSTIQICHASVGILMECLPERGWFSREWSPRENHPPEGRHSIRIPTLTWHICFIIPNKPQFGKILMKTTMTANRFSENGGRFAGGHFAGGHD